MADRIRIIPHEAVPLCGSFEVRFPDGRPSVYFYFDDIAGRRLRPDLVDSVAAKRQAKLLARREQNARWTPANTSRTAGCILRQPSRSAWRQGTAHASNRSAPLDYRGNGADRRFDLRQAKQQKARPAGLGAGCGPG
jgi:hypothetical protein